MLQPVDVLLFLPILRLQGRKLAAQMVLPRLQVGRPLTGYLKFAYCLSGGGQPLLDIVGHGLIRPCRHRSGARFGAARGGD